MFPVFLTPIAGMVLVILIVAIINFAKIHEQETEVRFRLHAAEMEHQKRMKELELELEKFRRGSP
jgi:hypothetical protein